MISKVTKFRVTPFRALIALLIAYLLSPLPLQVGVCGVLNLKALGTRVLGIGALRWRSWVSHHRLTQRSQYPLIN